MKDKPCKRHRAHPEFISDCVGCDIEGYNSDLSEVKGDLAELKDQYRWRDVKEELPEDDDEVLIYPEQKYAGNTAYFNPYDDNGDGIKKGQFYHIVENSYGDDYCETRPTHWMPFPIFEVEK